MSICPKGTFPVKTRATQTYKIVQIISVPNIAIGKSLCGFSVSSAVVEIASNPIYAKKIKNAPINTPSKPFGANGTQFSGLT